MIDPANRPRTRKLATLTLYKNHHKPIIKENIYNQVQNIIYNRNLKTNAKGNLDKYNGFIKCSDCECNMYKMSRTIKGKKQIYYYCGTYIRNKDCTGHYILEKDVDEAVISILNQHIDLVCNATKKINEISLSRMEYNSELKKIRLVELEKEIDKYKNLLDDLLKDYKLDYISKEDFEDFNSSYMYELNKLRLEKENIEKNNGGCNNLEWINQFKKTGIITDITRRVVNQFIDKIFIYENKNIEIKLKYKDQYQDLLKYLRNQNNML